jgi:hypothetical protein
LVFRHVFAYIFQMIGVKDQNLKSLVELSLKIEKEQEWDKFFKSNKPDEMIDFEKLHLFSTEKDG